jgi:hypothetical protein
MTRPEEHVVVFTGQNGNKKRFVNVVGPFDNKRLATNFAARKRNTLAFKDAQRHSGLSVHVRPLWPRLEGE